jgi:hypothetical protein
MIDQQICQIPNGDDIANDIFHFDENSKLMHYLGTLKLSWV